VDEVRLAAAEQAREHKLTPMMGRSHGIHAEPVTFGLKMALMHDEFGRVRERLTQVRERIAVGMLSGAVGTRAHLDPQVEEDVCRSLGLRPAVLSTQIIQRDRHAEFVTVLALAASSIDRWATEFRHLQRTEVCEVEEFFAKGQKGSSAMPHKRNPITGERLSGLARVIRGYAVTAMENVALWHERDISHSSAERIILPDACILLDYMLHLTARLVRGLQVHPENMLANMEKSRGLHASQAVLLKLTEKGLERQNAYEAVQRAALKTWDGAGTFMDNLALEPDIRKSLTDAELKDACGLDRHFRHVDRVFRALGLEN
jgi:adenylosuccinate lyase